MTGKPKRTESEMLVLLRARHGEVGGNGASFAFVTGVRSAAGFDSRRTLDAIAMGLWPSRGLLIDGFEIKCSRSDWLRELKKPEKAEEFYGKLDRFWIVAGDSEIVREAELPPGWGLIVAQANRLVAKVEATMLHEGKGRILPLPPAFSRSFLACLLREAVRVGEASPEEVREAEARGRERGEQSRRAEREAYKPLYDRLREDVRTFEDALGVPIGGFDFRGRDPAVVGRALRQVLNGEHELELLKLRLQSLARNAEQVAAEATRRVEAIESAATD